jgi:hypothetical protein
MPPTCCQQVSEIPRAGPFEAVGTNGVRDLCPNRTSQFE